MPAYEGLLVAFHQNPSVLCQCDEAFKEFAANYCAFVLAPVLPSTLQCSTCLTVHCLLLVQYCYVD